MIDNAQGFPFGTAAPWKSGDAYLGGQIVILPAAAAQANAVIAHSLRRVPRAFLVLDIGAQTITTPATFGTITVPTIPFSRGTTPWNQATFSLALPALSAPVTGVLV